MQIINTKLLKHPLNYLTIFLMVMIGGTFGFLVLQYLGINPATGGTSKPVSAYADFPAGMTPAQDVDVLRPALEFNNSGS